MELKTEKRSGQRPFADIVFAAADRNLRCNTAYPVYRDLFRAYESDQDILQGVEALSFYLHVPFCRQLCSFCEYTRFLAGDNVLETRYLDLLERQIERFFQTHTIRTLYGLDIGGGTPTSLSDANFERLLCLSDRMVQQREMAEGFEKSIEFSFNTISGEKLRMIREHGFRRISAGIQSMSRSLMQANNRELIQLEALRARCGEARDLGIEKINLDLMYGLKGQTDDMLLGAMDAIALLRPEQVTLYEMRYNRFGSAPQELTRERLFAQYSQMYKALSSMGYRSRFGQNTFSLGDDLGVSSYLRYRMAEGTPYKGFGISAQSMGPHGLSYGSLKNTADTVMPELEEITESSNYALPPEELAAKYVSIAMYHARFRLSALRRILGADPEEVYAEELAFLRARKLIRQEGDEVFLTSEGFFHYGAAAALFWSRPQKQALLREQSNRKEGNTAK